MNTKITTLTVLLIAGAAQAQLSYDAPWNGASASDTQFSSYGYVDWDGNPAEYTPMFTDFHPILGQPALTTIQNSFSLDTTNYPSIDRADTQASFSGQTAGERFEFSWDTESWANFADPINTAGPTEFNLAPIFFAHAGGNINFDQDVRVRVTFNAELSGIVGLDPLSNDSVVNSAVWTFGGNAFPNPFTAGAGAPTDLGSSFSFEADVAAGSELFLVYEMDNFLGQDAVLQNGLRDFHQLNRGSVVIEVIPAPSSLALLGLCGLAGVRRRR